VDVFVVVESIDNNVGEPVVVDQRGRIRFDVPTSPPIVFGGIVWIVRLGTDAAKTRVAIASAPQDDHARGVKHRELR
jgi:hypothetical protein